MNIQTCRKLLGERRFLVHQLMQQGLKFREIAARMGVSYGRVYQLSQGIEWRLSKKNPSVTLTECSKMAYELHEQGLTFKEIAEKMEIGNNRARSLRNIFKWKMEAGPAWDDGLSVRVANVLFNCEIKNRKQALEAFQSGRLNPNYKGTRNYGWKCHKEVAKWLGLPEPQKSTLQSKVCRHCGGKLAYD